MTLQKEKYSTYTHGLVTFFLLKSFYSFKTLFNTVNAIWTKLEIFYDRRLMAKITSIAVRKSMYSTAETPFANRSVTRTAILGLKVIT